MQNVPSRWAWPRLRLGAARWALLCLAMLRPRRAATSVGVAGEDEYLKKKDTHPVFHRVNGKNGAGDEVRTRDNQLGKLVLYQLSYTRNRVDLARPLRGVNAIVVAIAENPAIM